MIPRISVLTANPAKSKTLSEFISRGSRVPLKYSKFCFQDISQNLTRCIYNVLDDYFEELEDYFIKVTFSKEERVKYSRNPKALAYDVYGSTDLYSFILYINKMASVKEFTLEDNTCYLIHKDNFTQILGEILNAETKNLNLYNVKQK